jgi:[ribosomal protein S5]-alanine N-acetyltransferase
MVIIETERLILREFTPEDAAENYRIYHNPENMEFMGNPPPSIEAEREQINLHIDNYYQKFGFGLWATILKENNRLLGRCGLLYQSIEGKQELEISYLIDKPYWGRGLVTEGSREIVRLGFEKFNFPRIIAIIHPQNSASIRVAEKIGMKYERDVNYKQFGRVAKYILTAGDSKH